ncbi:MAG: bifunctional phosphoribosylaminoimidazolecarboxamide formyltransferase/IMP cyclohydrolase [Gemmatimonadaceae bacterium]|jgi:phosphoribosylaminoimidazolecarboxamide formyltransferase/IMP cyclohydrolase|nr:bifunctional phosphoribosylaminoimidazolecarboxamide formyltransferase/IMP cyclohydrolase [Gemmatimonadaceae bacterium]
MPSPRQALISVSDKTGVVDLARTLARLEYRILSTGGTAKLLGEAGVAVTEVADYTGFPEMLDGRVKTLHPRVHAGILARRDLPAHEAAMQREGIDFIDLVVVNLYPFQQTIARADCTFDEAVENIDIGGPTMVRAAAKNHAHVAIVTDPADYGCVIEELTASNGSLSAATRLALAKKAFSHTAQYDGAIGNYLTSLDDDRVPQPFPARLNVSVEKAQDLRYGENPHQAAAFYRDLAPAPGTLASYTQVQGKELSYNNIADADAAWECVRTFEAPACVIVKHANPCGVAQATTLIDAYERAYATDPTSAFGGILAFNGELDGATAAEVVKDRRFVEVVIATGYSAEALAAFAPKTNVRLLIVPAGAGRNDFDMKRVGGGLLVQTPDSRNVAPAELRVVTKKTPTAAQLTDLLFAWRVAKYVKSNAIVFCADGRTLGVGAGQMSRVDSARIASIKAHNAGLTMAGSVVASDAFFPFRDGLDVVVDAGAVAVIQPGGSMRDDEVIAAADERGIAMVLTGVRHFRH